MYNGIIEQSKKAIDKWIIMKELYQMRNTKVKHFIAIKT